MNDHEPEETQSRCNILELQASSVSPVAKLDINNLLAASPFPPPLGMTPPPPVSKSNKKLRPADRIGPPAKRKARWSTAENFEIIRRFKNGRWEDVSEKLPGRTADGCRLHYKNHIVHNIKWFDQKQTELAEAYERLKPDLWNLIAKELGIPWHVCEAIHLAMGENSQRQSDETLNHQRASPPTKPGDYGCFRCKIPPAFSTCTSWKRHMKEHETVFPCRQCKDSNTVGYRSYTRNANLVKHLLNTHNMPNSDASAQADTSRETVKRQYFSCGFCVSLFNNIVDQLNHIDINHFRCREDISGWNISKVIEGLIQQPGVSLFWQKAFGAGYPRSQDLTWNDSVARNLQLRLELSEESAEVLAAAAISQVTWTEISQDSDEAIVTGGFTNPHMEMDHGHGPGAPGNLAFMPVNIPPINWEDGGGCGSRREGRETSWPATPTAMRDQCRYRSNLLRFKGDWSVLYEHIRLT